MTFSVVHLLVASLHGPIHIFFQKYASFWPNFQTSICHQSMIPQRSLSGAFLERIQQSPLYWHRMELENEKKNLLHWTLLFLSFPKGYENFSKCWESDSKSSLVCILIKEKSAWRKSNAVVCCDQLFSSVTFHRLLPTDLQRRKLFLQWILFCDAIVSRETDLSSFLRYISSCMFVNFVFVSWLKLSVTSCCYVLLLFLRSSL